MLKKTLETAKKKNTVTAAYEQLQQTLKKTKETEMNCNKQEIKKLLADEIIKRYHYTKDIYWYDILLSDPEIKKAIDILNNATQYNLILKK